MTQALMKRPALENLIPRFGAHASIDSVQNALEEHGVVIVERLADAAAVSILSQQTQPWFDAAATGEGDFFGRRTRRFGALLVKAPATQELALNPLVLGVIDGTLRGKDPSAPKCDGVELSATQAIGIEPGEPPQFLHRDEDIWPFPHDFEIMAPVMWTLSAFTADNGATRFIPGSHLWPRDRQPLPGEAIAAEAPPGSAIVWLGGTLHGGGANRTSEIRKGLAFAYRLGWLAPQEKLLLTIPPDQARDMPEKLQRLIGYQVHRPALGVIEGRDPIEWLRGETRDLAPAQDHLTPQHNAMLADMTERPSAYEGFIT